MKTPARAALRKPCEECGTLYGPKIRADGSYQSENAWNESYTCSMECKSKREGRNRKLKAEERLKKFNETKVIHEKAFDNFLYCGENDLELPKE